MRLSFEYVLKNEAVQVRFGLENKAAETSPNVDFDITLAFELLVQLGFKAPFVVNELAEYHHDSFSIEYQYDIVDATNAAIKMTTTICTKGFIQLNIVSENENIKLSFSKDQNLFVTNYYSYKQGNLNILYDSSPHSSDGSIAITTTGDEYQSICYNFKNCELSKKTITKVLVHAYLKILNKESIFKLYSSTECDECTEYSIRFNGSSLKVSENGPESVEFSFQKAFFIVNRNNSWEVKCKNYKFSQNNFGTRNLELRDIDWDWFITQQMNPILQKVSSTYELLRNL